MAGGSWKDGLDFSKVFSGQGPSAYSYTAAKDTAASFTGSAAGGAAAYEAPDGLAAAYEAPSVNSGPMLS